jgi:hypothetical protein
MAFREKITVAIDFVTDGATRGLGSMRTAIGEADGAFGKMKAGGAQAFGALKAHAVEGALAAGTALVAFGVKAVGEFQAVALGAGQLRDSLGLTAEEASRLQEVGADLGISISSIESTIGRMNRTAETTPGKFDAIGASIVRNRDGTVNVNETFLDTVDALNRIPDASTRAAKAQEIFGRSWQDVSELIGLGADGVRAAMASVEDAKVIDDEEIEKARRFRDSMDRLKGIFEQVSISAGEMLVPALADVADTVATVSEGLDKLGANKLFQAAWAATPIGGFNALKDVAMDLGRAVAGAGEEIAAVDPRATKLGGALDLLSGSMEAGKAAAVANAVATAAKEAADDEAREAADRHRDALDRQRESADQLYDANVRLVGGELAVQSAQNDAAVAVARYTEVNKDAESSEIDKSNAQIQAKDALLGSAQAAADYRIQQAEANGTTLDAQGKAFIFRDELHKLASTMEPGSPLLAAILGYIQQLDQIPREITTRLRVTGQQFTRDGDQIGSRDDRHVGGRVGPGDDPNVQRGEVFYRDGPMSQAGRVAPRSEAAPTGGGGVTVLTVIEGNVYGDAHLTRMLDERDRAIAARLAAGVRS